MSAPPANCFRILVVDDLDSNRTLLRKILVASGYDVVEAVNGAEALEAIANAETVFDLIITDIEMPELDGFGLIREIRASRVILPIIAASGNTEEEMGETALFAGADVFLSKPFDIPQLRRDISSLIQKHRALSKPLSGYAPDRIVDPITRRED